MRQRCRRASLLGLLATGALVSCSVFVGSAAAGTPTYVRSYSLPYTGSATSFTPEKVGATTDGGDILLGDVDTASGLETTWLAKRSAAGRIQWAEDLGCFDLPPGSYAFGLSVQQTSDGGYMVAGGTLGCGSRSICPRLGGVVCGIVERLDSEGHLTWARVYEASDSLTDIQSIRQTTDGGFIAVGSAETAGGRIAALVMKLDDSGNEQWQRTYGGTGSTDAYFNDVQEMVGGQYAAVGDSYASGGGTPQTNVFVVDLDVNGSTVWQRTIGSAQSVENGLAAALAPDGDLVVAGNWVTSNGSGIKGGLLVELNPSGNLESQKAYSGGVHCVAGSCNSIGAVVYSVEPTASGGYVLAGDGDIVLHDNSVQLVPWLTEVNVHGSLKWQHFYFETQRMTGRPLSQYFASALADRPSGVVAVGYTEEYKRGSSALYVVSPDSNGEVPSCADIQPSDLIRTMDPALVASVVSIEQSSVAATSDRSRASAGTLATTSRRECP
jgi:serine-aspartate repeat-containing protein C/D/E